MSHAHPTPARRSIRWRAALVAVATTASSTLLYLVSTGSPAVAAVPGAPSGWTTTFSDDFNGAANTPIDSNWIYDLGTSYPGGAGNFGTGEVESVTNSTTNVYQDGAGHLVIKPVRDASGNWTSGRVETARTDFGAPAGGEMEITASLQQPNPANGIGYWPAFWAMGSAARGVGATNWPSIGELDIMEDVNALSEVSHTFHCGVDPGGPCNETTGIGSGLLACGGCQTSFHTYTVIVDRTNVSAEQLRFYTDGVLQHTVNESQVPTDVWTAAVDHGFFAILNVAIGGQYPFNVCGCANPTAATSSGAGMSVDYVAVYTKAGSGTTTVATPTLSPGGGSYTSAQSVTIADATPGATIHYTTDGSTPTASSATYTGPITVAATQAVSAIGVLAGSTTSSVASATYTISAAVGGAVTSGVAGKCLDDDGGASGAPVIIWDCNGGGNQVWNAYNGGYRNPASGRCLDDPGANTTNGTQLIIWDCNGGANQHWSAPAGGSAGSTVATPTFTPATGTYPTTQSVTIADSTSGAAIHYTTDGSTPTASSATYTGPISVAATTTVKAVGTLTGSTTSGVATATYTISAATGDFSQSASRVNASQALISFTPTTAAAYVDIHYTVSGGGQQNLRMTLASGSWTQTVSGLSSGSVIAYWFTYEKGGPQYDSPHFTYTQS